MTETITLLSGFPIIRSEVLPYKLWHESTCVWSLLVHVNTKNNHFRCPYTLKYSARIQLKIAEKICIVFPFFQKENNSVY